MHSPSLYRNARMNPYRRLHLQQLAALAAAATTPLLMPLAHAQTGKRLNVLIGFPAGGAPDTVARAVGEGLRELGYTAVVDNKAGAGGRLAADALLAGPADGSTIMLMPGGNLTIYPHIYPKLRYRLSDFALLGTATEFEFALAVGPGAPVKTLAEFIAWAKANPSKAQFGSPGAGTAMHFIGVQLGHLAKFEFQHIPYRGGAPALSDAMGGSLPALMTTLPNLLSAHKGGKVRILAHSGSTRNAALPDVPTFKEAGFPPLTIAESFVWVAPAKTPMAVQKELATALTTAVSNPKVKAALVAAEYDVLALSQEAIAARLAAETRQWADIVKTTGYKSED
ncbi:MAG: ABC transporter substrate-binding protein [Ideonella sp. MAG2]|nr:MAG: ABC transporter substrate-binding protein [Ideonella sp. MAG2]